MSSDVAMSMDELSQMRAQFEGMRPMTTFERAQLAAIFMSKWVDGSESTAPERMAKRVANAFAFADMMWVKAHEVKP